MDQPVNFARGQIPGYPRRYAGVVVPNIMTVKHDSKLEIACNVSERDIELACEELRTQGPAGAKAIEILRELGGMVSNLDKATGTIRLVVAVASNRTAKSEIDLTLDGSEVAVLNPSRAWDLTLDKVQLSTIARRTLGRLDVKKLGDVAILTDSDLRRVRGCGWVTVLEIERMLNSHGLSLNMKEKPAPLTA